SEKWIDVGHVHEIPENRAKKVCMPSQERIAIYRYEGKISAVSDVCAHQNGPLSEGKIVNGCITCPWHGYQYLPESGTSPPPFTEKIPTFRVRVTGGRILLNPTPLPPGTAVTPADVEDDEGRSE
ncbi:MAG: Rieske (2Fe-2S) protein, partial [Phycisphaerae bacterium]